MDEKLKQMRKESKSMTPALIIGKNGVTDQVVLNIKNELKNKKVVKIKILKSLIDANGKEETFNEIAEKTNSKIVHKIGFTISLTKN